MHVSTWMSSFLFEGTERAATARPGVVERSWEECVLWPGLGDGKLHAFTFFLRLGEDGWALSCPSLS